MSVLMRIGPMTFQTTPVGYEKLSRTTPGRWAKLERIGREPALQWLGPDTETITIDGRFFPHMWGGMSTFEKVRKAAGSGTPYFVASGRGSVVGQFVINSVTQGHTYIAPGGDPRKVEFGIELQSYGADGFGIGGGGGFSLFGGGFASALDVASTLQAGVESLRTDVMSDLAQSLIDLSSVPGGEAIDISAIAANAGIKLPEPIRLSVEG